MSAKDGAWREWFGILDPLMVIFKKMMLGTGSILVLVIGSSVWWI